VDAYLCTRFKEQDALMFAAIMFCSTLMEESAPELVNVIGRESFAIFIRSVLDEILVTPPLAFFAARPAIIRFESRTYVGNAEGDEQR
jgi:hypothetical protein